MTLRFLSSGDTGLTVQFSDKIDRNINAQVVRLSRAIDRADIPGVIETVPTYRSVLVHYSPLETSQATLISLIKPLVPEDQEGQNHEGQSWRLPICFDPDCAPDLELVAELTGATTDHVQDILTSLEQYVYMLGFAPGQPYLGDLPKAFDIPRRKTPMLGVPKGSVLVAAGKTTIYTVSNPSGWYIVGRTPELLFSSTSDSPVKLSAGDTVSFDPISRREFDRLEAQNA